jgi:pyrroloquinoline quinone (PQQ) biosynthesis protein C/quercetin dioxygenase-like cupin family protein
MKKLTNHYPLMPKVELSPGIMGTDLVIPDTGGGLSAHKIWIPPRIEYLRHQHPSPHLIFVLEGGGYFKFWNDGKETHHLLNPGDVFHTPQHVSHQVGADERGMTVIAVSVDAKPLTDPSRLIVVSEQRMSGYSLEDLIPLVHSHGILSHAFLRAFEGGTLTKEQVVEWLRQQFYFSISLPSTFAALYAKIPDKHWEAKRALIPLLEVEAWGSVDSGSHSQAFREIASYMNLDVDLLTNTEPKWYTREYIEARLSFCASPQRSVVEGVGAMGVANEILNLHLYRVYREGIHKISGLKDCPTAYFDAHLQDEQADFGIFASLCDVLAQSHQEQGRIRQAVIELLDQRVLFLDRLCADLGVK